MELQFVSFKQAVALKDMGFPQSVAKTSPAYYGEDGSLAGGNDDSDFIPDRPVKCASPTLELAAKWLRDEMKVDVGIFPVWENPDDHPDERSYRVSVTRKAKIICGGDGTGHYSVYPAYEAALSAGIDKAIEFLSEKILTH